MILNISQQMETASPKALQILQIWILTDPPQTYYLIYLPQKHVQTRCWNTKALEIMGDWLLNLLRF